MDGSILLDCGVPRKAVSLYERQINLVLLTHIHGDHFNKATIRSLAKDHPLLRFGCCVWMVLPLVDCGVDPKRIDRYDFGMKYTYQIYGRKFVVEPVELFHDVPNCGYKIYLPNGKKAFYATDTCTLQGVEAPDFDLYMVEANHDIDELHQREREKKYDGVFSYEERAAHTHLSKQQADEWLIENMAPFSQVIYLHGHQEKASLAEEQE